MQWVYAGQMQLNGTGRMLLCWCHSGSSQALTKWRLQEREERHSMEPSYSQSCCTLTSFNHGLSLNTKAPFTTVLRVGEEDNHISVLSDVSEQCADKLKMSGEIIGNLTNLVQSHGWLEEQLLAMRGLFFSYGFFSDDFNPPPPPPLLFVSAVVLTFILDTTNWV